jgi:outer membrane protein assembly factor BamB
MPTLHTDASAVRKPLRLWPGVAVALIVVVARLVLPAAFPGGGGYALFAAVAGAVAIAIWWLFFSRARWSERIGGLLLIAVGGLVTKLIVHESVSGALMGMMVPIVVVPSTFAPLFVAWAVATRRVSSPGVRWATMVLTIAIASGLWTLLRMDGVDGETNLSLSWRWTPTPEDRLLAQARDEVVQPLPAAVTATTPAAPVTAPRSDAAPRITAPAAPATPTETKTAAASPSAPTVIKAGNWPGFRGSDRNSTVRGVRLATDWKGKPPVELWRKPIGPGWSSFAVSGDLIYTQEQRGEHEVVSCYRLSTGEPVWRHQDNVRFYEANGGPGPRATPTVRNGRVYTQGATGVVNALDAATGSVIWTRNAQADTGAPIPGWGFAGSPLVVDDLVIVAASGRLVAYDIASGDPRWTRTTGGGGYSSPHLATIGGVTQILLLNGGGIASVAAADGSVLWEKSEGDAVGIVQPAFAENGDVLIASGDAMGGLGVRRLAVSNTSGAWTVEERWASRGLKPYYNDFVVHEGHAYGFDGTILSCIELQTGERKWKGGRYGAGQMVLLADQDMLLVLSEEGELVLVAAQPDKHTEIARFKAIEGKTWNHPVVVGDVVLVRNGEEMAAVRLPTR